MSESASRILGLGLLAFAVSAGPAAIWWSMDFQAGHVDADLVTRGAHPYLGAALVGLTFLLTVLVFAVGACALFGPAPRSGADSGGCV